MGTISLILSDFRKVLGHCLSDSPRILGHNHSGNHVPTERRIIGLTKFVTLAEGANSELSRRAWQLTANRLLKYDIEPTEAIFYLSQSLTSTAGQSLLGLKHLHGHLAAALVDCKATRHVDGFEIDVAY
ncbi:hypothetical protein HTG_17000 [Natrinema mahii]|nr:hypothetical protein HTG_17000 [Natrinema mahii]